MVDSGQSPIRRVDFASRLHPELPVEVIERRDLLKRFGHDYFATPERPSFCMLLLVRSGRGVHVVDFQEVPMMTGRLVQTRPGQVQLWDTASDYDGSIILSRPEVVSAHPWFPRHAAHCDLDPDSVATAEALVCALQREQVRFVPSALSVRLMNALFAALRALFDQCSVAEGDVTLPDAYVAFRAAIEHDLAHSHNVRDYVRSIGYSERTVSRACIRATGQSAKKVLRDRIVLEAQRLLALTDETITAISTELGFSQPTNFHKFFLRHTSERPSQFRQRIRARAGIHVKCEPPRVGRPRPELRAARSQR